MEEEQPYENEVLAPFGQEPAQPEEVAEPTEEAGAEPEVVAVEDTPAETEKKNGVQKRIDELTRKAKEAEREAAHWKEQAQQKPAVNTEVPAGKPVSENYDTYEDFVEALTDWKADVRDARKAAESAQQSYEAKARVLARENGNRIAVARTHYADYDEVTQRLDGVQVPQATIDTIMESDQSAELFYYLGNNPDETVRLQGMTLPQQIKTIGRIEAMLEKKAEVPLKKLSSAPEPIKPIGNNQKVAVNPDTMSDDEWLKYERARLAKVGRLY